MSSHFAIVIFQGRSLKVETAFLEWQNIRWMPRPIPAHRLEIFTLPNRTKMGFWIVGFAGSLLSRYAGSLEPIPFIPIVNGRPSLIFKGPRRIFLLYLLSVLI